MIVSRILACALTLGIIIACAVFVSYEHFAMVVYTGPGGYHKGYPVMPPVLPPVSSIDWKPPMCQEPSPSSSSSPSGANTNNNVILNTIDSGSSTFKYTAGTTNVVDAAAAAATGGGSTNPYDKEGGQNCLNWCVANKESPTGSMSKETMLSQHNAYRANKNKPPMTWNQNAFCYARCTPKRCTNYDTANAHDTGGSFSRFAQNLAWANFGIKQFYDEGAANNCPLNGSWTYKCGHYDNMMSSSQVGCNFEACGTGVGDGSVRGGVELRCNYS